MVNYDEHRHLGYIVSLFSFAGSEYGVRCSRVGYVLAWDSPPSDDVFPISCYLIGFGSGILMFVVVRGGVKVVDGILADATGENPVVAPSDLLYEKAMEYGCRNIKDFLKKIEKDAGGILSEIARECERHEEMTKQRRKTFWDLLVEEFDLDGKESDTRL